MEPKFQSSFIPKKPVIDSPKMLGPVRQTANIFSVIATIMFIITLFAVAGTYAYLKFVENNISKQAKELISIRSSFNEAKIQGLIDASARLNSINSLLENHVAVSGILVLLQKLTLKNVSFENFGFQGSGGKFVMSMDTVALSYNSIADQRDQLMQSTDFSDVTFSNFTLNDKGMVTAKVRAEVLPKLISYKDYIENTNSTP